MSALHQEIEYPGGRYQITGWIRMIQGLEGCIKNNVHIEPEAVIYGDSQNPKYQTNPNDPNSKFETHDPPALIPPKIISEIPTFAKPSDTVMVYVLVIEY